MPPRHPSAAIVIPAHNAAKTLDRALTSASAALRNYTKLLDAEIIVVDDASRDATAEVAQAHPGVRLIRLDHNRGAGFARNEGVRQSTAGFLFFLDADDVFYDTHVATCLDALLADDSLGYVYTRVKLEMPIHPDWQRSMDESCPINFCVRRVWHDMILGFPEEPDFRIHGTEDTLYRKCLRDLVIHKKLDVVTCEQFVSPGNALDRQRAKLAMSMAAWNASGIDDGFVMTDTMKQVAMDRLMRVAKLKGEVS